FFFQAIDGIRHFHVTGVQTCALPILTSTTSGQHHVEPRRSRAHGAKKPPAQKTRPPEPPAGQQTAPGLVPPATWGGGEHAVVEEIGRAACRASAEIAVSGTQRQRSRR